ncbi:MAG: histidine phosphatase family protein [Phycisphaerales bacterium]|nr:histidine phosphatase family protein [Phycisphaerales bacterium]
MRVYLIRHAKAERDSPTGRDDDRPLKPRGIRQATWLGEAIAKLKKKPGVLITSPVVRALDTARILGKTLNLGLEVDDALSTKHGVNELLTLLFKRAAEHAPRAVAIVAHNPTLEIAASALLGATSAPIILRTGEALIIDIEDPAKLGSGTLHKRLRSDDEDD